MRRLPSSRRLRSLTAGVAAGVLLTAVLAGHAPAATLFGLVNTGELFASTDQGATWTIRSTLPVRDAVAIAAGVTSLDLMLLTETGSFYRSGDAGLNWTAASAIAASDVAGLASTPGLLLAVTRSGSAYASTDVGNTWSAVGTITAPDVVAIAPFAGAHVAATRSGSVYRSDDGGASWSAIGAVTTSSAVGLVAHGASLYLLTSQGDVAVSANAGVAWFFTGTLNQTGMTALVRGDGELIATTSAGEIAASAGGQAWSWRGVINQLTVHALGTDVPTTVSVAPLAASGFALAAPWPNPARKAVSFALDLAAGAEVHVDVYDMAGRRIATPVAGERVSAGRAVRTWTPAGLVPGVYTLRARVGNDVRMRRIAWMGGAR